MESPVTDIFSIYSDKYYHYIVIYSQALKINFKKLGDALKLRFLGFNRTVWTYAWLQQREVEALANLFVNVLFLPISSAGEWCPGMYSPEAISSGYYGAYCVHRMGRKSVHHSFQWRRRPAGTVPQDC
jgi:hypothetical protein